MRNLIIVFLFCLPMFSKAQIFQDTGYKSKGLWATSIMKPPADTLSHKQGIALKNGLLYIGNGTSWNVLKDSVNARDTFYILATGQSNSGGFPLGDAGGSPIYDAQDTLRDSRVQGWDTLQSKWTIMISTAPLTPPMYSNNYGTSAQYFLAKKLARERNIVVRIVNQAEGGQPIASWHNGITEGPYMKTIKRMTANAGILKYDLIIWQQGESDGDNNVTEAYYKKAWDSVKSNFRMFTPSTTPIVAVGMPRQRPTYMRIDPFLQNFDRNNDVWDGYATTDSAKVCPADTRHFNKFGLQEIALQVEATWKSLPTPFGNFKKLTYTKNATGDSSIITLPDGARLAVKDSVGTGGGGGTTYTAGYGLNLTGATFKVDTSIIAAKDNVWSLTGNVGTNPANNFIGTRDAQPLIFRTNNNILGRLGTDNSVSLGLGANASNFAATSIGYYTNAGGFGSTSFGYGTNASGNYSTASGNQSSSQGDASFVTGMENNARSFSESVFGMYGTNYTPGSTTAFNANDRIFSVGNGIPSLRSDALVVLKNGNVIVKGLSTGLTPPTTTGTLRMNVSDANGLQSTLPLPTGGWSLTGNSGTDSATNFIGTTDAKSFRIRTNNIKNFEVLSDGTNILDNNWSTRASGSAINFGQDISTTVYFSNSLSGVGLKVGGNVSNVNGNARFILQADQNIVTPNVLSLNIGTIIPIPSALINMESTTKGFLLPRMTTTERNAIATPAMGLQVYNTTTNTNNIFNGTNWTGGLTSSSTTITILHGQDYVFTGTTATWTLPAVSTTLLGRSNSITIKNRGTGVITLNSNAGSTIYSSSAVSTFIISPGEAIMLMPDGQFFNVE